MHQEEQVGEHDQEDLFDQRAFERADGAGDQGRAVVGGHDAHPRGETALDLGDLRLDAGDDFGSALAVPLVSHTENSLNYTVNRTRSRRRVCDFAEPQKTKSSIPPET